MKKVRKQEVEELILLYYQMFIECAPDYELEETVTVDINSIYIRVIDHRDFDDEEAKKKVMEKFAEELRKITFGNLEVTYMGVQKDEDECSSWMYIANAYDIEDEDEYEEEEEEEEEEDKDQGDHSLGLYFDYIGN